MKILLIIALFYSGSVFSAMTASFTPYVVSNIFTQGSNATTYVTTTFRGLTAANNSVFASRVVPIAATGMRSVLAARAASALFNPWLAAAMLAAGYAYNSSNGQVGTSSEVPIAVPPSNAEYYCAVGNCDPGHLAECTAFIASAGGSGCWLDGTPLTEGGQIWFNWGHTPPVCSSGTSYNSALGCVGTALSFAQWTDPQISAFINSLTPAQQRALLTNPSTNRPDDVPELNAAGNELTSDYEAETDTNPDGSPNTTTSATVNEAVGDNGIQSVSDVPPEIAKPEEEQKTLCEMSPDILACQPLGDELTAEQIPVEESSYSFVSENLTSNASCPTPANLSLSSGSISMSYQPLCDLAIAINPVFIIICTLAGLYIVVGAART